MENMDKTALYAAFKAKDTRFDGRFFVGIATTKIYCRPICWARQPKEENCTYYPTAAAAEQAGYRPCLLCRPEVAPGAAPTDATKTLVQRAAHLLEESCGSGQSLEDIAGQLGCTGRHLRRVFADEYGVSPVQYLQTCRLLLAKNLLTGTNLSVLEVAMAAGFGSLRRFNALFQNQYHLSPTALRKEARPAGERAAGITIALGYRPPYRFEQMLSFISQRAIPGVEVVQKGAYMRTVRLQTAKGAKVQGWLKVEENKKKSALQITMAETLLPVVPQLLAKIRSLFDLNCDPAAVYEVLQKMNEVKPGLCVPGTRVPGCFDAFELAVRAVLGQQVTVKAASTLAGRMTQSLGMPLCTGVEGLTHTFPTAEEIAALPGEIADTLGPLGITGARANTIKALAQGICAGALQLTPAALPEEEIKKLCAMPGIGGWTAQYIAMRAMDWPDAFLETDLGVKKALAPLAPKEMLELAENWRPWRSYATINLWNTL